MRLLLLLFWTRLPLKTGRLGQAESSETSACPSCEQRDWLAGRGAATVGGAARTLAYSTVLACDQSQLCHIRARDKYTLTCALLPASQAPTNIPLWGVKEGSLWTLQHLYTHIWLGKTLWETKEPKMLFLFKHLIHYIHIFTYFLPVLLSCN